LDQPTTSPTSPLDLSVFVVTLNEEQNLRRCLSSLDGIAAEIVVVDSGSTDATRAVADEFEAAWHHRDWSGFRDQKNHALSKCSKTWVLCLDADEALSAKLRNQISSLLIAAPADVVGARCPRLSKFLGRWIRHGDWYPDRQLRLFRRDKGTFAGDGGHDHAEVEGEIRPLSGDLLHYSYPSLNAYIDKLNGFSDAFLEQRLARGTKWSFIANVTRSWWRFFRSYVLKRGFLDGFPGYWIAKATAFSTFLRHSRLYEHQHADPRDEP
jgi:glycosyltransferase involved in cell wall biosynthesis